MNANMQIDYEGPLLDGEWQMDEDGIFRRAAQEFQNQCELELQRKRHEKALSGSGGIGMPALSFGF